MRSLLVRSKPLSKTRVLSNLHCGRSIDRYTTSMFQWLLRSVMYLPSQRRPLSSSDTEERSALTRPFEGTPGNQQNDGYQRHQWRQQQQHQQQRRAASQWTAGTTGGFRGWISHAVIHHIAGYRRAVRLCRGTAYRCGVHCVAGIRVVRRIPGAAAGVMSQAGSIGDRVRDVALVDATGEQGVRKGPDGEHRHVLTPVRRPRPWHACRL